MKKNPTDDPIVINCESADQLPLDRIIEFQGKLKRLSETNRNKLINSICSEGFIAPLFLWDDAGEYKVLDGHQRLKTLIWMREKGWDIPMIPVDYINAKNEKDAKAKLLKITSQYGEFDLDELNFWLDDLDEEIAESIRLVDEEIDIVINSGMDEIETVGDDDIPEVEDPVTKRGDLWELGNHRLFCEDSTEIENIMTLLNGNKVDFVFTDPPYGIEVVRNNKIGGDKPFGKGKNGFDSVIKAGDYEPIKGDDTIDTAISSYDISKAIKAKIILLWGGNFYAHKLPPAKCWVVWDKETDGNFGDGEIAWCSAPKSIRIFRHKWSGMIKASECGEKRQHPTQKPIALAEWAINEFMKPLQKNILDFFGGAGFTLLAAEKLNKKSFLMELSEHYCDVTVNRYITWCSKNDRTPVIKLNGEEWHAAD